MDKENELILELSKGKYANCETIKVLLKERLDLPYVLGQLLYNRVGATAYVVLKDNQLLQRVNREFRNSLKAIYEHDSSKTDSFICALKTLINVFAQFQFPYAFLKGAYLVNLYEKGLRTSNDIDILINPQNITDLSNTLKAAGYKQGNIKNEQFVPASRKEIISSRMNRGEIVPFVKEVDYPGMKFIEIDVNFSLGFKPGMDEKVVHSFLNRTQPEILNRIQTLDKVDFLLHLCAHLYKEATVMNWVEMGRDISLYKYCDINLFIQEFLNAESATILIKRINDVGLNKECYYALNYTKMLFLIENTELDRVLMHIRPDDITFMKQVLEPQTGKVYTYDMNYRDWVFCSDRRGKLYET